MTVDFNHDSVMKMYEAKRKKFLVMTGHQGQNLAALNSRVDTGLSQSAKGFKLVDDDKVWITTGTDYDIYLERRYGIMKKTEDELKPDIDRYMVATFG